MNSLTQNLQNLHLQSRKALAHLKQTIEDIGGCDHSVGICCCGLMRDTGDLEAAINTIAEHHPTLASPKGAERPTEGGL